MANKKPKILIYILYFLFILAMGVFFGYLRTQPVYAGASEKNIINANGQNDDQLMVDDLFEDYTQTSVKQKYNSIEKLEAYEETVKNFASYNKEDFERAKKVVKGEVRFDPRREFSNLDDALNKLTQYGDIRNYCQYDMHMKRFGSDRQPTGIYAYANDKITIYMECESDNYRPYVVFTQFEGSSSSFKSQSNPIMNGKNVFEAPDLVTGKSGYSKNVVHGGAIHLSNPRTPAMQGDVKVYIEGGGFYPVYKKGEDEALFLQNLTEYYKNFQSNKSRMFDMAELVADHVYFTISASACYKEYVTNGHSVNYMRMLLEYSGVTFDVDDPDYKEINEHLNINIRDTQYLEGAGAYAGNDHVGIYKGSLWEEIVVYVADGTDAMSRDWGFAHEIGHMLDTTDIEITETTNNMYAKYAEMNLFKGAVPSDAPTHDHTQETFNHLVSDDTARNSFFSTDDQRKNYFLWWYLEAVFPGFWPRLQNLYRNRAVNYMMSATEKMVFLSSVAAGIDLSYYFERWGYKADVKNSAFKEANASEYFSQAMQQAELNDEIQRDFKPKLWYQNAQTYENLARKGLSVTDEIDTLFDGTQSCEILSVFKDGNQYTIKLKDFDDSRLLGYEVIDTTTNKVVGFTYSNCFVIDMDRSPKFKAVAYDIYFQTSKPSEEKSAITSDKEVCSLNGRNYTSLSQAIADASSDDVIKLLDDVREEGIRIYNKNITITVDDNVKHNIIMFAKTKEIFYANGDTIANLKILGKPNAKIIFEGNNLSREMAFIRTSGNGDLLVENAKFRNSATHNTGGLYAMSRGDISFKNCEFENLSGANGGAIYINNAVNVNFVGCTFTNNISSNYGGAIMASCENLNLSNCSFEGYRAKNATAVCHNSGQHLIIKSTTLNTLQTDAIAIKESAGDVKIYADCHLAGVFYSTKTITLCEGMFSENDDKKVMFDFSGLEEGAPAFESENFEILDENIKNLNNLDNNNAFRLENGKVYIGNDKCMLKFNCNGQEIDKEVKKGDLLTLDGNLFTLDDKYPATFSERDGKSYNYGEKIEVKGDMIFDVTLADLLKIKWIYLNSEKEEKTSPKKVYLPQKEGINKVLGWLIDEKIYSPGTFVEVTENKSIMAIYEGFLYVVFKNNGEIISQQNCKYNASISAPVLDNGYLWFANNKTYSPNSNITIKSDTVFNSISEDSPIPKNLEDLSITLTENRFVYSGFEFTPEVTIMDSEHELMKNGDYKVDYFNNKNAGKAYLVITPLSENYYGTVTIYFDILKAEGSGTVSVASYEYGQNPTEILINSNTNPKEGAKVYYKLKTSNSYSEKRPINAGEYDVKVVLVASRNYNELTLYTTMIIAKADHPKEMPEESMTISRKAKTLHDVKLNTAGWQWETPDTKIVEEIMTAIAVYSDKENFVHYTIQITLTKQPQKEVSQLRVDLDAKNFIYDGREKTPKIIAKDGSLTLILGVDYDVQYKDNKLVGQATAIVTFKNDYIGTKILSFTISKADKPAVNTTIYVNKKVTKLSDIPLPKGFIWENGDIEISTNKITAKAIYNGDDVACYKTTEIYFKIIIETQDEPMSAGMIAIIISVPVTIIIVACVVFAIKRHRRNRW